MPVIPGRKNGIRFEDVCTVNVTAGVDVNPDISIDPVSIPAAPSFAAAGTVRDVTVPDRNLDPAKLLFSEQMFLILRRKKVGNVYNLPTSYKC